MADNIEVVKTPKGLRGWGRDHEEAYNRFKAMVDNLEPGEMFTFRYSLPRNKKFHRKFFALLNFLYEHWEPSHGRKRLTYKGVPIEKNFEQFRKDMIILAGFGKPTYELGRNGRVKVHMDAKSIAFDKMSEDEFEKLYRAVIDMAIKQFLPAHYQNREDVDRIVAEIERFE